MRHVRINPDIDRALWNTCARHPMQSYEWGEARESLGTQVVRFALYDDRTLIDVYQMTVHALPLGFAIGYVARSSVPTKEIIDAVREFAQLHKIFFIKWEPYVPFDQEKELSSFRGMRVSGQPLFTEWNLEVDLERDVNQIFDSFSKNTRYAVRYAEKHGVVVREMSTDEGFQIFADLYFDTCRRQKYHGHNRTYHRALWEAGKKAGYARIYVAFYNDKPHTAFQVYFFNGRAYYPYSGSSGEDRTVSAGQFLMWQVIQDAKIAGCTVLDLWGALPESHDPKDPWSGFTRFKQGFGSQYVHMTRGYDFVIAPLLYHIYRLAYYVRKLLMRLHIV